MDEDREKMSGGFDLELDTKANGAPVRPAGSHVRFIESLFAGIFSARLDKSAPRIRLTAWVFLGVYGIIAGKLLDFGLRPDPPASVKRAAADAVAAARPDLLDRNGALLATDIKVMSVFAEPRRIIDKDEAVELLTAVLPDLDAHELRERLSSRKGFVWVKRAVTPKQQKEVYHLGLPGVGFLPENKRV
jgi:cell division protein FtsI (penicillin-binding protein 3)